MTASVRSGDSPAKESRLSFLTLFIATGLFSGYSPWASGTVGTLVGVLLYLIPGVEQPWILLSLIVLGFGAGVITSGRVAAVEGHRLTATAELAKSTFQPDAPHAADPSIVVIDEIVGIWLGLLWMPKTIPVILLCFLVFRFLDIVKPEPARMLERIPRGWGIMLDDVVAGLYTNILCHLLLIVVRTLLPHIPWDIAP